MAKANKPIRIDIPAEIHRKIKVQAAATGKTMQQIIVEILAAKVERE
jgi:plasmid stability protein